MMDLTPAWLTSAVCASTDPELFFPAQGRTPRVAKRICGTCDARPDCLAWAVEHGIIHGVYGGLSAYERRALRSCHRPGCGALAAPNRRYCGDECLALATTARRTAA